LFLLCEDARSAKIRQLYLTLIIVQDIIAFDIFMYGFVVVEECDAMHGAVAHVRNEFFGELSVGLFAVFYYCFEVAGHGFEHQPAGHFGIGFLCCFLWSGLE